MVEIGIPVYKARSTLPTALDSLVAQTKKNFIVCISIDGDEDSYDDIIQVYIKRGLKIRKIVSKENCGAGMARQKIIDSTQCDYIMFLDADDMFMPRAVEVLYSQAKLQNYDLVHSSFIRESTTTSDILMSSSDNVITWFHGKIYKVNFLRKYNIRFLPQLRTEEDAYFNSVVWNTADTHGMTNEVLYLWCDNKYSVTREIPKKEYFLRYHCNYMIALILSLDKIFSIKEQISVPLITSTLVHLYEYYMTGRFYKCDETEMDNIISIMRNYEFIQTCLSQLESWCDILNKLRPGQFLENQYIIFYEENFHKWIERLVKAPDAVL